MRVALTGSSGMTGLHMKSLLDVRGIACVDIGRSLWNLKEYKTPEQLDAIMGDVNAVFHFGAFVPSPLSNVVDDQNQTGNLFDVNVRSCLALAEWATLRKIPLVFLSGATVYKDPYKPQIKENDEKVVYGLGGLYGYSKLLAENVLEHYRSQGLNLITIRPSSIYGSFMPQSRLVANFLQIARENKVISLAEPVTNKINLVHSADVALASLTALQKSAWGIFNVPGPKSVTIQNIAEQCVSLTGKGSIKIVKNKNYVEPFDRFDLCYQHASLTFGYQPQIDLYDGISTMIENRLFTLNK